MLCYAPQQWCAFASGLQLRSRSARSSAALSFARKSAVTRSATRREFRENGIRRIEPLANAGEITEPDRRSQNRQQHKRKKLASSAHRGIASARIAKATATKNPPKKKKPEVPNRAKRLSQAAASRKRRNPPSRVAKGKSRKEKSTRKKTRRQHQKNRRSAKQSNLKQAKRQSAEKSPTADSRAVPRSI